MIAIATDLSKPEGRTTIKEIQPLAWSITAIPEQTSRIYALKLPDHWRVAIQNLEKVDRVSPITSLYASLHVIAPEIIYFFPGAFARNPEFRPKYWFITEAFGEQLDPERLLWGVQAWLNACYSNSETVAVSKQLIASDLEWETVDLKETSPDVLEAALPGLLARWLLQTVYEFRLSNGEGHPASWPLRLAPSRGPDVDLVTWPPISVPSRSADPSYSYYLKFRIGSVPWSDEASLLCQPGIRRWVSQPLVKINGNGKKTYVDLPWGREKSVYISRQSKSWLTQKPTETSLLRLALKKYHDVIWVGRLPSVLGEEDIPDPMVLLSQPAEFQPDVLIVHDNLMNERHPVGLGIEAADRWEVFNQLTEALPSEIRPAASWSKTYSFNRNPQSIAHKYRTQVTPEDRRNGASQMRAPALIEICCSDITYWKKILLEELGLSPEMADQPILEVAQNGTSSVFKILECSQSANLLAELPPGAAESNDSQYGAERARARQIARKISQTDANAGILLEMPNYRELSKDAREARRDPKRAARWGFAKTGRVSQFIQPEADSPDNYEQRVRNGIRDLLRQMDFHLNPLYTGFKKTSLPTEIDLIGLWQIRLNPRQRGEHKVTLPLVVHAPSGEYKLNVCIPGDNGPTWYTYRKAQLALTEFSGEFTNKEAVRYFFAGAIQKLALTKPTLVLLSEQNLRDVWPELKDDKLLRDSITLREILPLENSNLRIARLRFSRDNEVPLVCPTHTFGKFQGLYHNLDHQRIFYSIQKRPLSASRRTGLRQRDAWRRLSWNPSTVEIAMARLQPLDVPEEWAWIVHRLREESSHTDAATLLPEPLHSAHKIAEYVFRITND